MPIVICKVCTKEFYIKPSHLKLGWGKYCSRVCQVKSQFNGQLVKCFVCAKETYRSRAHLKRSSSGKYFCSKHCQTLWRNSEFVGEKHGGWRSGINAYRDILKRSSEVMICKLCSTKDERVLIGHHKDHNRMNNNIENLVWLCFNCHFLVHHYKEIEKKLENSGDLKKKLVQ